MKPVISILNFRPVALTATIMKIFGKLVRSQILGNTEHALDPMQFAYRPHGGVEDATLTIPNSLLKHRCHPRILFIDFSSAFKTVQPHLVTHRLLHEFNLRNNLGGWILDFSFLTNRTQRVRLNGVLYDQAVSSTGSPQGCVLSPLLFIL